MRPPRLLPRRPRHQRRPPLQHQGKGNPLTKSPTNASNDTTVILENGAESAHVVDVTLVSEPFDGAQVTYANRTTLSFPDVSSAQVLRKRAQLMRATDVNISGAAGVHVEAEPGETVQETIEETPSDPVLIYLLYEREDPAGPSHWLGLHVCRNPGQSFSPIRFTLSEDGGQQFDPECFDYGTPTPP